MKLSAFMVELAAAVKEHVAAVVAPLVERVKALEERPSVPGPQGERGEKGEAGPAVDPLLLRTMVAEAAAGLPKPPAGKDGRDGIDGKDADPAVIEALVAQRVAAAVAALPVPKDGKDVDPVEIERIISERLAAAVAALPPPARGEKGERGEQGRDALALDVLPAIDEAKGYPRGTWARHLNGLWRAAADTHGMRNWECMVPGIAAVSIAHQERSLTLTVELSNGSKAAETVPFEVPLDRGVYTPEGKYRKGDGVTWGGSWWIAQADEPTDKPGTSEQWRLAVKRGRDGKDAR